MYNLFLDIPVSVQGFPSLSHGNFNLSLDCYFSNIPNLSMVYPNYIQSCKY